MSVFPDNPISWQKHCFWVKNFLPEIETFLGIFDPDLNLLLFLFLLIPVDDEVVNLNDQLRHLLSKEIEHIECYNDDELYCQ